MDTEVARGSSLVEGFTNTILQVDPPKLQTVWGAAYPHLVYGRKHLEEYLSLSDVYAEVYSGRMQMWLGIAERQVELVGLTQIHQYPRCRTMRFVWVGGSNMRDYLEGSDWFELCARRAGCDKIEVLGRRGWIRLLGPLDYEEKAVLLVKDISGIVEM